MPFAKSIPEPKPVGFEMGKSDFNMVNEKDFNKVIESIDRISQPLEPHRHMTGNVLIIDYDNNIMYSKISNRKKG